jgi:hypothetical protein
MLDLMTVARGSPVRIFQYRETRMGHKTILSAEGCVFTEQNNVFLISQLERERCMKFGRDTGLSHGTHRKFSECFPVLGGLQKGRGTKFKFGKFLGSQRDDIL